jgi:hypothetical protein
MSESKDVYEQFLDEVEEKAKEKGIKFFAAAFDRDWVRANCDCKTTDVGGLLFFIATNYPQVYQMMDTYMKTGAMPGVD